MGRYIPSTGAEQQEMLRSIGLDDFRQLYKDVPEQTLALDDIHAVEK